MWMFIVTCFSLLSATCSYCYKYSWNLNDDGYQYHPQHQHHYSQTQMPRDIMVDLINDLGLKLLAIHNENNDNNIALSPYGAFSVLVALGEGVRNEAAHEIAWATQVPSDVRLVRVGLRDIHRHLKSYFIPKEGFLGGLTFNDDNVILNPEYEAILRFYGYDVASFNNALYPGPATTEKPASLPTTTFNYALSETDSTITTVPSETTTISTTTTAMAPITTTRMIEITTVGVTSTTFESPTTETTPTTTTEGITSTIRATEPTTIIQEQTGTTLNTIETSTVETTSESTTSGRVSRENTPSTMSGELTTTNAPQESTTEKRLEIITTNVPRVTTREMQEEITTNPATTIDTETTIENESGEDSTTEQSDENQTTENQSSQTQTEEYEDYTSETTEEEQNSTETSGSTENNEIVTTEGNERKRRSLVDYLIARYYDDHHYKPRQYHHSYQPEEPFTFLVYNKYREGKINFMRYDTVLPFHYVPHLDALALSFPLDSSKYYLLLLLPAQEKGIDKLICDIRVNTNLKYIIDNLRYTHVIATIPSFMLRGYVSLTSTLQKLGIRKVFEPRQADFTPMTNQSDIYVKNIEQAITVTIRNYVDPTLMEPYRNLHQTEPVYFKADHPFLYFVIDSELHVTLMAGKVVNPINSRIS